MRIESSGNCLTVLAVDIGTSGCRAIISDQDGAVIAAAERTYEFFYNCNGFAEQDPERIFNSFIEVIQHCTAESHVSVDCVVIGSVLHSLMLLNGEGIPLTPLSIWTDTRAIDQCQRARDTFESNKWHERTGCPLSATYPLYRLIWYKEKEPALYNKFRKAISIKSYIHYRLFGRYVEDHSVASGSGMFNIQARAWDREIVNYLGLNVEILPEAVPVEYELTDLPANSLKTMGLSVGTTWIVGGADGPMAHAGTAGYKTNVASLTIGTSGAVRMQTEAPQAFQADSMWCYVLNSDSYTSGMATNNGGNVLDWYVKAFPPEVMEWQQMGKRLASARFDPELFFMPFLFRERNDTRTGFSSAHFIGLKQWHGSNELLRAVVEGIVFNVVSMMDKLRSIYGSVEAVAVSGSLANTDFVRKIVSATSGLPITGGSSGNASLLGLARIVRGGNSFVFKEKIGKTASTWDEPAGETEKEIERFAAEAYPEKYRNWKELSRRYDVARCK